MSTQELTPERRPCIHHFALGGRQVLGFDTGLDSRSFARARLANLLSEPSWIVFPDGEYRQWKAEGIVEVCNQSADVSSGENTPTMHFWGPAFKGACIGSRLDDILNSDDKEKTLSAVLTWLKAHLALGDIEAPVWPFAAFIAGKPEAQGTEADGIYAENTVFFPQTDTIKRCIQTESKETWVSSQRYVHPDLRGMKAVTFTTAALLYQIFTGTAPFTAADEQTIYEDMNDGNFLPIAYAAPGLDETIAAFIQEGLTMPDEMPQSVEPALTLLNRFKGMQELKISCFFRELSDEEKTILLEEKSAYQKKKNIDIKTKRFIARNKTALIAGSVAAIVLLFFLGSIISAQIQKPSTKGMDSFAVVEAYYNAFDTMNHQMMEACVFRSAGKDDVTMVTSFFVITKARQAYGYSTAQFLPAHLWLETGQEPQDLPVFGITDLQITLISESGSLSASGAQDESSYSAVYTLWIPRSANDPEDTDYIKKKVENPASGVQSFLYTDELQLRKIKGKWRIVEIMRNGKIR